MSGIDARHVAARFNFSRAQWKSIRDAVRDGCVQPEAFSYSELLSEARHYIAAIACYQSRSRVKASWAGAARALQAARLKLCVADPANEFLESGGDGNYERYEHVGKSLTVIDVLKRWEALATRLGRNPGHHVHPRVRLYVNLFGLWKEAGGYLRKSRENPLSDDPGRLGGPTIRYLQAVTLPVMGDAAPKPEGLRKIIDQHAVRMERMLASHEVLLGVYELVNRGTDQRTAWKEVICDPETDLRKRSKPSRNALVRARLLVRGR